MGRIIQVRANDLKPLDVFSSDGTMVKEITRIHTEMPMGAIKAASGIMIRVVGICQGNEKIGEFPAEQMVYLWQDG